MEIQYASDLHLEFRQNREFLKKYPLNPLGDILLLGGDILPFGEMEKFDWFFDYLSANFEHTYWIPGNHEYYQFDLDGKTGKLYELIRSNVQLVNNQAVDHGDWRFIFSTLWTRISPDREFVVLQGINDFRYIRDQGNPLSVARFNALHTENLEFLTAELNKKNSFKTLVMTHHVPTFMQYPPHYKTSPVNEAFAVELHDLIYNHGPDYWIYGHHHYNCPDFSIGKSRLLTNQLGYVAHGEHKAFDGGRLIGMD